MKEFKITDHPLNVPLGTHLKLIIYNGDVLPNPKQYQKLPGKLIYLMLTRPDINFFVHTLSLFMHQPTTTRMEADKRVLRYLLGTYGQGILLASSSAAEIISYCDSDWASCPNSRRSTTGFYLFIEKSPISWKRKKQAVIARFTIEVEYLAMTYTVCEITRMHALLKDMGLHNLPPTILKCDNMAPISRVANSVLHECTKRIELDSHFICD